MYFFSPTLPQEYRGLFFSYKCMICTLNTNPGESCWLQTFAKAFDRSAAEQSPELDFFNVSMIKKPCLFSDRMWTVIARLVTQHEALQNVIKPVSIGCPEQHIPSPYYQVKGEVLNTRWDFV